MSHFYGDIQGNRGASTKGASKASGISGHIRGWNVGARVRVHYDERTGLDTVTVYATSGSSGGGYEVELVRYTRSSGGGYEVELVRYTPDWKSLRLQLGHIPLQRSWQHSDDILPK